MKKVNWYLIIGMGMLIFAVCFFMYALGHPEASFSINIYFTYILFIAYIIVMICMIVKGVKR